MDRRLFLRSAAASSLTLALLPDLLRAQAEGGPALARETLLEAERARGLAFTDPERGLMLQDVAEARDSLARLRAVPLANDVPPALGFRPLSGGEVPPPQAERTRPSRAKAPPRPADLEELAHRPATELAALLRERRVSSVELTGMYLQRLARLDPALHCVVTLLPERALAQARRADDELARGRPRGPLHGIPWGAKDLLAVGGARTTWGARPFRDQVVAADAAVVARLDAAGAVLVAKLSCGALAWGDVWFGGHTRNPWKLDQGSSGSSAGSAAAVAAGLVGFAVGTETWGSIVSPGTRCGATGLRPTFGRVSRRGCMALAWSLDKIGPLARSVEDCALVLDAVHGADPGDPDSVTMPFAFDAARDARRLRVGYLEAAFAEEREGKAFDDAVLAALRGLGIEPRPVALPDLPAADMMIALSAEAAAAFDDLTRSGRDDELNRQTRGSWPNVFRAARLLPAVEYVTSARLRTVALREMARLFADVDVVVAPTYGGQTLALTNLTGHPAVVVPSGFREDGTPVSVTFVGGLFGEDRALTLARAYQEATGWHRRVPPLFGPGASPAPTEAFLPGSLED